MSLAVFLFMWMVTGIVGGWFLFVQEQRIENLRYDVNRIESNMNVSDETIRKRHEIDVRLIFGRLDQIEDAAKAVQKAIDDHLHWV